MLSPTHLGLGPVGSLGVGKSPSMVQLPSWMTWLIYSVSFELLDAGALWRVQGLLSGWELVEQLRPWDWSVLMQLLCWIYKGSIFWGSQVAAWRARMGLWWDDPAWTLSAPLTWARREWGKVGSAVQGWLMRFLSGSIRSMPSPGSGPAFQGPFLSLAPTTDYRARLLSGSRA